MQAGVAQLVEQLICNQRVGGSNPLASSKEGVVFSDYVDGEVPERSKGSDCKSDGAAFAGSNPALPTI